MKKVFYILAVILEALLLVGTYVIHYFTRKKMGMARYVVYKNHGWEDKYPMTLLQTITVIVLIALAIAVLVLLIKKKSEAAKIAYAMNFVMVVLVFVYTAYTIGSSTETMRAYYFISGMLALTVLLQEMKALIGTMICRR